MKKRRHGDRIENEDRWWGLGSQGRHPCLYLFTFHLRGYIHCAQSVGFLVFLPNSADFLAKWVLPIGKLPISESDGIEEVFQNICWTYLGKSSPWITSLLQVIPLEMYRLGFEPFMWFQSIGLLAVPWAGNACSYLRILLYLFFSAYNILSPVFFPHISPWQTPFPLSCPHSNITFSMRITLSSLFKFPTWPLSIPDLS